MEFRYAYRPDRLDAENPKIIEGLLEIAKQGKQEAVNTAVLMLSDLYENGLKSRFVKLLQGIGIWELKSRSRGGHKGGIRIYFLVVDNEAVFVNAEVKSDSKPSLARLEEVALIWNAHEQGIKVF